jgi:hypothetical protein
VFYRRSVGVLNIATGEVHSFMEIAKKIVAMEGGKAKIRGSPRSGAMPHNGYRSFDPAGCLAAFPDFRYTALEDGLRRSAGG